MNSKNIPFAITLFLLSLTTTSSAQFGAAHSITQTTAMKGEEQFLHDMDKDGDKDLLVLNTNQDLLLFRNDGSGHFAAPEMVAERSFYIQEFVDFNHDSLPDILVNCANGYICWMPNDGDGTFSNVVPIGAIAFHRMLDVNNDGEMDIIYLSNSTEFRWLENEGFGIFIDDHPISPVDGLIGTFAVDMIDINGDGLLDFVYAKYINNSHFLFWRDQKPDGTFNPTEHDLQLAYSSRHQFVDLDYDGDLDLASWFGLPNYYIFKWQKNDGSGNFGAAIELFPSDSGVYRIADVDGDGFLDIPFTTSDGHFAWGQNDGQGQFSYRPSQITVRGEWLFGDISGDQASDIIFSNTRALFSSVANGQGGYDPVTSFYPEFATMTNAFVANAFVADADGDGDADVFFHDEGKQEIGWFENDGKGDFLQKNIIDHNFDNYSLYVGDLNNDGYQELTSIYLDSLQLIWRGAPNGNYGVPDTLVTGLSAHHISAVADVEGDGDLDWQLFSNPPWTDNITYGWLENDGSGNFSPALLYQLGGSFYVDIDMDGLVDGIDWNSTQMFWHKNYSAGNFGPPSLIGTYSPHEPQNADLDQDGDQDLLFVGHKSPNVQTPFLFWIENQNNGSAWVEHKIEQLSVTSICRGDFNLDGNEDVCIATKSNTSDSVIVKWYANEGAGNFSIPIVVGQRNNIQRLQSSDFDNDGDLDLSFHGTTDIGWFENFAGNPLVKGRCFFDANANGQQDAGENPLAGIKIKLEPNGQTTFSAPDGTFQFYASPGDFVLSAEPGDCFEGSTIPATFAVQLPLLVPDTIFAFGFKNTATQLSLAAPITAAPTRCGFTVPCWISLKNEGCLPAKTSFSLHSNGLVSFVSADPAPVLVQGDSIVWQSLDSLQPGETRNIRALLKVAGTEHLGDTIKLTGFAWPIDSAGNQLQPPVSSSFASVINCAYDPNDKLVNRPQVPKDYAQQDAALVYTIRFQNTGTDTAFNVKVLDTLTNNLDWATFRLSGASHPCMATLDLVSGEITYRLDNILLPDSIVNEPASHGFISFSIQLKSSLLPGTMIRNSAAIYFDFNPPVLTNIVTTEILRTLDVQHQPKEPLSILVSPNPNAGTFNVNLPDPATAGMAFRILGLRGELLQERPIQEGIRIQTVQASDLPSGLYFLQVISEGRLAGVEKFVKE